MEIDIKKIMGETPKNGFDASDKMIKAQQELLEALHIIQSVLDFPDTEFIEINKKRMQKFLIRFCK